MKPLLLSHVAFKQLATVFKNVTKIQCNLRVRHICGSAVGNDLGMDLGLLQRVNTHGGMWYLSAQGMARKVDDVPPSKPPKFDYSGDLQKVLTPVDLSEPKPGFEDVSELTNADPAVAKLFSLEFATGQEVLKQRLDDILEKVKDHPGDTESLEYKIARYTILIRNQMNHMQNNGHFKDKVTKSLLIRRIQARRKFLTKLREQDSEKFEWLLQELKIKHIPANPVKKESKREVRIRLVEEKAEQMREAKIEAVKKRFAQEKEKFLMEKEEELSRIKQDLEALGIDDDMTSIEDLIKKLGVKEFMPPEEKKLSIRKQKLQKKFELYGKNRKKGKIVPTA